MWSKVNDIPDAELWRRHSILKERLIAYARSKTRSSRLERGEAADDIKAVDRLLDPNVLTLGFARRFSPYKRGALLFRDLHRAIRILSNPRMPIQIIFAGKAHPADDEGKRLIQRLMEWCRHPALRDRIAFIEDYDMYLAKLMVQGVDVWLDHPRRPEACGTSGQKVALNGGINCGIRDGWWAEAYRETPNGQPPERLDDRGKTPKPATRPYRTRSMRNPSTTCWSTTLHRCTTSAIATAYRNGGLV